MRKKASWRQIATYVFAVVMMAIQPLTVFAETTPPAEPAVSTPAPAETQSPTSSPAPSSDPASTATTTAPAPTTAPVATTTSTPPPAPAEPERVYSYNERTGRWDSDKWVYNPATRKYELVQPSPTVKSSSTGDKTIAEPEGVKSAPDDQQVSDVEAVTDTDIKNVLDSIAASGSATVSGNTTASNAASGDASATATIINNVNSSISNSSNDKAATFVADVMGDVSGDIMLKPMLLKAILETEAGDTSSTIKVKNGTNITNDINLDAHSGDASVVKNTKAGDATTGSANTVANVVNIVNSMIAANQSFIGTINIYGNLDGDILIAPDFLPQLLASNMAVPNSSPLTPAKTLTVNSDDTKTILNNVNLSAASGAAAVAGNTNAGSATSGQANTNTVIFNMTGHEIIAKNSLLVFINVLGKWVGVIVDAPTGATSALLGNGVSKNMVQAPDLSITAENSVGIINNLNLNSMSGDALVASNTHAGNATSGNATASANIANIANSSFGLSDWFGVLYINVFGSWFGSLGIDTDAGSRRTDSTKGEAHIDKPIEFIPKGSREVSISRLVPMVFGAASNRAQQGMATATNAVSDGAMVLAKQTAVAGSKSKNDKATLSPLAIDTNTGFGLFAAVSFIGGLSLVGSTMRKKSSLAKPREDGTPVA